MTSSAERKENGSDDDMHDMLEIYEQCEYILWIIKEKKTKKNKIKKTKKQRDTYTHHTKSQTKFIVIWTIKNKMKQNKMNNIDNTKIITIK